MPYTNKTMLATARALLIIALLAALLHTLLTGASLIQTSMSNSSWSPLTWLLICCLLYMSILAIPFAPGMEIGLLIMAIFGLPGVFGAWLATLLGLINAYLIGHFCRDCPLILRLRQFGSSKKSPKTFNKLMQLTHRSPYLALAILLNTPGNSILGGGGGIAMAAGALGNLKIVYFIPTVAVSTCLIPLFIICF